MHQYPKWIHHPIYKEKLVKSAQEHAALGEGWGHDSSVWRESKAQELSPPSEYKAEEKIEAAPQAEVIQEKPKQKSKKK